MELPRHLPMASPYGLLRRLHHASRHSVFFAGKEMGEDALRLISDYRTRLVSIRSTVASESKIIRAALKWEKSLGLDRVPFDGKYNPPDEKMYPLE
jgi:Mg2+ and Co2+ transporter CorA